MDFTLAKPTMSEYNTDRLRPIGPSRYGYTRV